MSYYLLLYVAQFLLIAAEDAVMATSEGGKHDTHDKTDGGRWTY